MDFTGVADHIVAALTEEGYEVPVESIQTALDSFVPAEGAEDGENHTCDKSINGKDGLYVCGKEWCKNQLNGMWFCGTENSGHYKSALAAEKKSPAKATPKAAKGKAAKAGAGKAAKASAAPAKGAKAAKSKTSAIVSKIRKVENIDFHEVVPGSGIWVENESTYRIVADPATKETYGVLAEDNETVLDLTDEAVSFCEVHNLNVRDGSAPAKKPSKAAAKGAKAGAAKTSPSKVGAKVGAKAGAAKTQAKASKAGTPAKTPPKASAKAPQAKAKTAAPPAKAAKAKAGAKVAPAKGKAAAPPAKASKAAKGKSKAVPSPSAEDDETLQELQNGIENAAVEGEPDVSEIAEDDGSADVEATEEVDLGDEVAEVEEEPAAEEEEDPQEEEEEADIVEDDEGEAIEDGEEEGGEEAEE